MSNRPIERFNVDVELTLGEVEAIRKQLTDRLNFLRGQFDEMSRNLSTASREDKVESDHGHGRSEDLPLIARMKATSKEMGEIPGAFDRLIRGGYGACLDCEEGIEKPRLANRPSAPRCCSCQEARDDDDGKGPKSRRNGQRRKESEY